MQVPGSDSGFSHQFTELDPGRFDADSMSNEVVARASPSTVKTDDHLDAIPLHTLDAEDHHQSPTMPYIQQKNKLSSPLPSSEPWTILFNEE